MADDLAAARAAGAAVFADPDVAACYHPRSPYPAALFDFLCALPARRGRALDIGCGPGPVARPLADRFAEVVALDPSAPMIERARAADGRPHLQWLQMRAEDFDTDRPFDLVTAGASLHWTDPERLFPKLSRWTPLLAVLHNDPTFPLPPPPCGLVAWADFLEEWNPRVGRTPPAGWRSPDVNAPTSLGPHDAWVDVEGQHRFAHRFSQSVEDFVASCHARVSWHRRMMGETLARAFDAALTELMLPFAHEGQLQIDVVSELIWGRPRAHPRPGR